MADVSAAAYADVRDYIQTNWTHFELRDGAGAQILLVDIAADTRLSWTHAAGANPLEVTGVFTGSDLDIPAAQVAGGSALYKGAAGSMMHAETFASTFTFNNDADQLTVRHRVEVPDIA